MFQLKYQHMVEYQNWIILTFGVDLSRTFTKKKE